MPPSVVKNKEEERLWDKAKVLAEDAGEKENYAYINGIFKQMTGKTASRAVQADSDGNYMSVTSLEALEDHAQKLRSSIDASTPLPDWVEAKITRANADLLDVYEFVEHGGLRREQNVSAARVAQMFLNSPSKTAAEPPLHLAAKADEALRQAYLDLVSLKLGFDTWEELPASTVPLYNWIGKSISKIVDASQATAQVRAMVQRKKYGSKIASQDGILSRMEDAFSILDSVAADLIEDSEVFYGQADNMRGNIRNDLGSQLKKRVEGMRTAFSHARLALAK